MNIKKTSFDLIKKGTVEIIPEQKLKEKLSSSKNLSIKWGADPSAPDLHLGHTVILRKLKQFQDMGHEIVFLIGDFTAMIGDPTGKSETRKPLTKEDIKKNAKTYKEQVFKILDKNKTAIVYNSSWLDKMSLRDVISLTSKHSVARMLERDDFAKRFSKEKSISIHEFLYPLLQGYDSVHLKSDVEIGGTDQKFNLLVGRQLQKDYGQEEQTIITMPILEGTDGKQKMSKSLGNHIGLMEPAKEIFGKIMSIPDESMIKYFTLLTDVSSEEISEYQNKLTCGTIHPRDLKEKLAKIITATYHSKKEAEDAAQEFKKVFSSKGIPDDIPSFKLSKEGLSLIDIMVNQNLASSKSEARRLIKQNAVSIDSQTITDETHQVAAGKELVLKVGKRKFLRII